MSGAINWYARLLLRLKSRDCSGSFRCYRVPKLSEIDFSLLRAKGYAFQEEILYRCRRVGCTFQEVPFTFEDVGLEALRLIWGKHFLRYG